MNLITREQAAREALVLAEKAVLDRFRLAVRPIYRDKGTSPEHLATATYVEFDGQDYVITAAHVVDNHHQHTLFIGQKQLQPITLVFNTTTVPAAGRDADKWDFSFARVDRGWRDLGIVPVAIDRDIQREDAKFYTIMGFPNSRNRKRNPVRKTIRPTIRTYTSNLVEPDDPAYSALDIHPETHVVLRRDPKFSLSAGRKVNSFQPRGMSGGPIIALHDVHKMYVLTGERSPAVHAAAIFIEKNDKLKVVVGTKLSVIAEAIRRQS